MRPRGVGALTAVVVLVALTVDEHGGVSLGLAKQPARQGGRIAGPEGIMKETLAVGFEDDAVAVGMFVVARAAAAEGNDGIRGFPARARDHPVVAHAHIVQGGGRCEGLRVGLIPRGGLNHSKGADVFGDVAAERVIGGAADPSGDGGVDPGRGVAKVYDVKCGLVARLRRGVLRGGRVFTVDRFGGAGHGHRERVADRARVVDEFAIVEAEPAVDGLGEHREVGGGVAPIAHALVEGAVGTIHRREGLGALPRHFEPLLGFGVATLEPNGGEAEAAGGDDFEIRGVENQRPAAQIETELVIILGIETPALHAIRKFHAVKGAVTRGRALAGDLGFYGGHELGRDFIPEPVEGVATRDGRLGGALEADGVFAAL